MCLIVVLNLLSALVIRVSRINIDPASLSADHDPFRTSAPAPSWLQHSLLTCFIRYKGPVNALFVSQKVS
jgi:hypothetical protein